LHLAEVLLARESSQVPEKNEQSIVLEVIADRDCAVAQVIKTEFMDGGGFHCSGRALNRREAGPANAPAAAAK
jgi:hypothetical protein